jgi:hypothetical protein
VRRLFMAIVTSMAVLLTVAAPVGATNQVPTGNRINLFLGDQSYPASTAFHIKHGFLLNPTVDSAIGKFVFTLEVDGVSRPVDFRTSQELPDGSVEKWWYFNFPNGMTGTHTFVGHHRGPCGSQFVPCNGQPRNTVVDLLTLTGTVTFN